jgi:histone demethylase JARID1
VEIRGGFATVCKGKKWAEIGRDLGYSGKIMSSLSTSLKNSYSRYLQPYEEWVKSAKPGVQQQIEAEFGGPITPSPVASPMKNTMSGQAGSPIGSSFGPDSPGIRAASSALAASVGTPDKSDVDTLDATPITSGTPSSVGGFTAVNAGGSGGFTPVNSGFTPVNTASGIRKDGEFTPSASGISSTRESPEGRSTLGSPLKRQRSQESGFDQKDMANGTAEDAESGERRSSKRLKKGMLCRSFFCDFSLLQYLG